LRERKRGLNRPPQQQSLYLTGQWRRAHESEQIDSIKKDGEEGVGASGDILRGRERGKISEKKTNSAPPARNSKEFRYEQGKLRVRPDEEWTKFTKKASSDQRNGKERNRETGGHARRERAFPAWKFSVSGLRESKGILIEL